MFIYTLMESKNASQERTFLGFTSRGITKLASDIASKRKKSLSIQTQYSINIETFKPETCGNPYRVISKLNRHNILSYSLPVSLIYLIFYYEMK